jgi:hypothetical protein
MRKFLFITLFALTALPLAAKPAPDFYFEGYEKVPLEFLRQHYTELENGRRIQFEGSYKSHEWLPLYQYQHQLKQVGLNIKEFNIVKFSFKEDRDSIHYSFPILLLRATKGDGSEFKGVSEGTQLSARGTFYNLKNNEWVLVVDTVERIDRGGLEKSLISDYRMAPTPTPTATITSTPGPNVLQKIWAKVNPKESPTPDGTVTPVATESPVPTVSASPAPAKAAVKKANGKKALNKKGKKAKSTKKTRKPMKKAPVKKAVAPTPTPNA